ncbi:MAG: ATP synthase F1 subunit gamma [Bacteroidetes bacterium]|nr:MAG: ATP synthase F1 subunit gamma [Bacteroidota bacterium]
MANLKEVRTRINSVKSTQQITKAMKMVSAAKLRRAQDAITQMRPYAENLQKIIANLSANMDGDINSPYTEQREPNKVLIVAITSDRGLCGAFNANVVKNCLALVQERYARQLQAGNVQFLTIGNKGTESLTRKGYKVINTFATTLQNLTFDKVRAVGEYILNKFAEGEFDRVEIVYNEFKNVLTQIVRANHFLPVISTPKNESKNEANAEYIFEPSKNDIILELIPKSLKTQLYKYVLDSNASEQGARMTSMDNATNNADALVKELQITYNKTRQAAITKEILEIVGGAEALKGE